MTWITCGWPAVYSRMNSSRVRFLETFVVSNYLAQQRAYFNTPDVHGPYNSALITVQSGHDSVIFSARLVSAGLGTITRI